MTRKILSILSVVAVTFALVLGSGMLDTAKALQVRNGDGYTAPAGQVNLFGLDNAGNPVKVADKDSDLKANKFAPDFYGLLGKSQL